MVNSVKPKVALAHDFTQSMGGAERVLLELARIFPDAPIYTLTYDFKFNSFFAGKKIIVSPLQAWSWIPTKFLLPVYPFAIEQFDFSDYDLVISSSHSFAKNIITPPNVPHISYIHSPMRYIWDTWHTYLVDQRLGSLAKDTVRKMLSNIRLWDFSGAGRADVMVANSKNVRGRIRKFYRRDAEVIYPPVDTDKITPTKTNKGYFLVITRLSKYKRVELALQACQELDLPLVIIGKGEEQARLQKLAGPHTRVLGWVSDAEKIKYLENARALVFPGEDDFGIVPVEAMAAGKPIIAYKKGGLLESVVEGKTGIFFPDQNVDSLKQALRRFIAKEKSFNYRAIAQHASKFSAAEFRRKIKALVADVLCHRHYES